MQKQLTITLDADVYDGLFTVVGSGRISDFIEQLVRPYVTQQHLDLDAAYAQMAQDEESEQLALEWADNLIGETLDETW